MAEALSLLLKQLLININHVRDMSCKEALVRQKDALMNLFRKLMLGYENEEVQCLFEELELLVDQAIVLHHLAEALIDKILEACEKLCNIRFCSTIEAEEIIVGFDDEVATLLDQLTGTSTKQLQVISIAGMAGLGKTSLARKLYRDPLIEYIFDIRALTSVSQVYCKDSPY